MKNYCFECMNEIKEGCICTHCLKENSETSIPHYLKAGTVLCNKYIVGNPLGEGGFGITYIGIETTLEMKVAIKEFFPNGNVYRNNSVSQDVTVVTESQKEFFEKGKERFLEEAKSIAKFVREPGIVDIIDYFEENGTAYIIMEYLDGKNLLSYVRENGSFKVNQLFDLMLPVIDSLDKMHKYGIIHRDISPENIMYLENNSLELTDFGSARYYTNEEKEMSVMLKQGYAPEEQYRKNGNQGPWTDVYGLCATIYRCITGCVPIDALDRMINDDLKKPSQMGADISEELETVLMYGLAVYSENRCQTMRELSDLIKKALNNHSVNLKNGSDIDERLRLTRSADAGYKTRTADILYDDGFEYMNRNRRYHDGGEVFKDTKTAEINNKGNSTTKPLIVIIVLLIGLIISLQFFGFEKIRDFVKNIDFGIMISQINEDREGRGKKEEDVTDDSKYIEDQNYENATKFISADASSVLPSEDGYTYYPSNVLVNDNSCWTEDVTGTGIGEWILLNLPEKQYLSGIQVINGYAGSESQYENNGKVKEIRIDFSDGETVQTNLNVFSTSQRKSVQIITFSKSVATEYIKITILNATEAKYTDTCLTYVAPYIE